MPLLTLPFTSSLGYGDHAASVVETGDGRIYLLWVDGGTLKGSLHQTSDRALIAGPWDTNLTGLPETVRIDADEIRLPNNQIGILLLLSDAGETTTHTSPDGRTFTS